MSTGLLAGLTHDWRSRVRREVFRAAFTGKLTTLRGLRFDPPFRVEQGQVYEVVVDPETGDTTLTVVEEVEA